MQQGPLAGQASGSTRPPEAASLQVPTSAPSRYLCQWAGIHCTWLAQLEHCPSIGAGRQRKRITTQHLPPQHRAPESVLSEQRESCANSKPACCVRWVLTVCWTGTVLLHPFMLDRWKLKRCSLSTEYANNHRIHKQVRSSPSHPSQPYLKTSNYCCHSHIPVTFMSARTTLIIQSTNKTIKHCASHLKMVLPPYLLAW